jgi:hypothetical protein
MRAFAALSEIFLACAKLQKNYPALKTVALVKIRIHYNDCQMNFKKKHRVAVFNILFKPPFRGGFGWNLFT